jgi:hypothetical protein
MWPFKTKDEKLNEAENKKLRNQLDIKWNETHETKLPHPNSEKNWYDLRAEIMEKDREIETLKKILEFSEMDEQEWRDRKEIFNFMVKKGDILKERIKELEAELNVLTTEGRPEKEKESVFEKRD